MLMIEGVCGVGIFLNFFNLDLFLPHDKRVYCSWGWIVDGFNRMLEEADI